MNSTRRRVMSRFQRFPRRACDNRSSRRITRTLILPALLVPLVLLTAMPVARADGWKDDPVWYDGLVEKAVYSATRVVYNRPRPYEAIFFTNKENHDQRTLTKADKSDQQVEVWKHNQIEDIPTPNYH